MKKHVNALMIVCALSLVITFISKSAHIRVNDFNAYYKTAVRAQHLETPYQTDGDEHPYKYPPLGIALFFPFGFFSYNVAKVIYGLIELGCCFAIPFLSWKIISQSKLKSDLADFKLGLFWSFLGTLRFLDSEFQENQVGTLMATFILLGCWLITSNAQGRRARDFFGALCIGIGGLLKFYGVIAWGEFLKSKWQRFAIAGAAALLLCLLIPNPLLWKSWWMQVHATGSLNHTTGDPILQGWFPLLQSLGLAVHDGTRPFFYFLPILVGLYFYLPRLGDPRESAFAFTLSMMILFVVSVSLSPLPWQHSYSTAWALLPLIWMTLPRNLRQLFIAICLFLAISPKAILGSTALSLESHQTIYICMLTLLTLGAVGARRVARAEAAR